MHPYLGTGTAFPRTSVRFDLQWNRQVDQGMCDVGIRIDCQWWETYNAFQKSMFVLLISIWHLYVERRNCLIVELFNGSCHFLFILCVSVFIYTFVYILPESASLCYVKLIIYVVKQLYDMALLFSLLCALCIALFFCSYWIFCEWNK